MKKQMFMVSCIVIFSGHLLAEVDYQIGISNVLRKLSSPQYIERMSATNYLDALIVTTTNGDHISECRLLKAIALIECAEIEHDDDAWVEATNLCRTVKSEYASNHDDWRFFGACLIEMQSLAQRDEYARVYCLATNAVTFVPEVEFERSTNIWCALFGTDIPSRISLKDAVRVNAADALLSINRNADIGALTNGLSQIGIDVITELLTK